jgi:hypothetical protein
MTRRWVSLDLPPEWVDSEMWQCACCGTTKRSLMFDADGAGLVCFKCWTGDKRCACGRPSGYQCDGQCRVCYMGEDCIEDRTFARNDYIWPSGGPRWPVIETNKQISEAMRRNGIKTS